MGAGDHSRELLKDILRDVSRSFYLTLRAIPAPLRKPIGIAYLLARATDTIADTEAFDAPTRLLKLDHLRDCILSTDPPPFKEEAFSSKQTTAGESTLLRRVNETLAVFRELSPEDQGMIKAVLETITSGQELDLRRFQGASKTNVMALEWEEQLDDYAYRVAGCVGEFWTRICARHLWSNKDVEIDVLIEDGIRFGKGLQYVNILRDIPADIAQGRCYIPLELLNKYGLTPRDLAIPSYEKRFRPVYDRLLAKATEHLEIGWRYTTHLPASSPRLKLACSWPVLIGKSTIGQLESRAVLDPENRIKISRTEVKKILLATILLYPFGSLWKGLWNRV